MIENAEQQTPEEEVQIEISDEPEQQAQSEDELTRYSGARFKLEDGAEVRIINDDEVIGTILNPDDIVSIL